MITRILLVLVVAASSAAALPGAPGAVPLLGIVGALLLFGTGPLPVRRRAAQVGCVGLFAVVAVLTIATGGFPFQLLLLPVALRALRRPNPVRALRTARDAMILAMAVLSFRPSPASLGGAVAATLLLALLLPRLHAERIARFEGRAVPVPAGAGWALPAVAAVAALLFVLLPMALPGGDGDRAEGASTLASRRPRPGETGGGGAGGLVAAPATRRVAIGEIGRLQRDFRPILEVSVIRNGRPAAAEDLGPLFRSGALEEFDGTTWQSRDGRTLPIRGQAGALVTLPRRRLPKGEAVEQRLRFLSGGSDALFCLGMPTAVGGDGAKAGLLLVPRGEIRTQESYPDGAMFTIRSVAVAGEYAAVDDEDLSEARHARLRLVPPGHERAAALARTDVMGGTTGLDGRALLARMEAFLARRCKYSLDIAPAGDATPVEAFLFDSRRGHCELFASAAAVMLRSLGVPARVVVGFRGGLYDEASHRYTLRGADAHAWCEAWFEETGWVTFDPTPGIEAQRPDAPEGGDTTDAGAATAASSFFDRLLRFDGAARKKLLADAGHLLGGVLRDTFVAADGRIRRGVLAALAFAAALLVAALALRRRVAVPPPATAPDRPPAPVPEAWGLLLTRLAAMGLRRQPSETGLEFVARAASSGITPPESLDRLAAAYAEERFGARIPSDPTRTELRALAEGVLRASHAGR